MSRWLQVWFRVGACLLLANLLVAMPVGVSSSIAAEEGTPPVDVQTEEPTNTATEDPILRETVAPTEVTEPVETIVPTEVPIPTETVPPTPEPTTRPDNTDTLVPDGNFRGITLESEVTTRTTVDFTYQVTTPRQGTRIVAEVRDASGAVASGWTLSILSLSIEGEGTVTGVESSALTTGASFPLTIAIQAPADVSVAERVSLHVWSAGLLDDEAEEAAVEDMAPVADFTILPPPATETPTATPTESAVPPATPSAGQVLTDEITGSAVINGGDISCTPNGTSTITISSVLYFAASFACTDTIPAVPGSATYSAATTSPWLVRFNSNAPATTPTATLSGLLGAVSFTLTLLTPTTTANGTMGSATVWQGTNPSTTVSSTRSSITNGGASGLYNFECADPVPVSQTIAQGGTLAFTCTFWGLATADVATLITLKPTLKLTAPGGVGSFLVGGQPVASGASTNLVDLLNANVLTSTSIPITFLAPCAMPTGPTSIAVQSTLDLTVLVIPLPLATFNSTVPVTVSSATTNPPTVSVANASFGTSAWGGTAYQNKTTTFGLTVAPPVGCASSTWNVTARATSMTSGGNTIPASAITYTGTGNLGPNMSAGVPNVTLDTDRRVLSGTAAVPANTTVSVGLRVQPPATAPVGAYSGTITVTAASGP